jgi:acetyl esterase/lipase
MCASLSLLKKISWLALATSCLLLGKVYLGESSLDLAVQVLGLLIILRTLLGTAVSVTFIILFDLYHNPYHLFLLPILYIVATERVPRWRKWSPFQLLFFPAPASSYSYYENERPVSGWGIQAPTIVKRTRSSDGHRDIHWIEISGEKKGSDLFPRGLIVYFHGNGADCGDTASKVATIQAALNSHDKNLNWWAVSIEYPGYGPGKWGVSDCHIVPDAMRVLQKYWSSGSWQPSNTIVIGSSIGTGPACQIGVIVPDLRHVALISPYTSLVEVARDVVFPDVPGAIWLVRLLIAERFNSRQAVKSMKCSLSLHHGVADRLIPVSHSRDLYACHRWSKILHELQCGHIVMTTLHEPQCGHNDIPLEQFSNKLCDILFGQELQCRALQL